MISRKNPINKLRLGGTAKFDAHVNFLCENESWSPKCLLIKAVLRGKA